MINIGNTEVQKIYIGDAEVNKIYLGDVEVYSSSPTPPTPYSAMPLTFKIISGGTISWRATSTAYTKEISYQINDGEWTSIVSTTAGVPINLSAGDIVKFKGDGAISTGQNTSNRFRDSTIVFSVEGNIMSLIDSTGFTTATTAADHSFRQLFAAQTGLTSAENLILPATTIGTNVYKEMFKGCTNLTKAPSTLPATTLAQSCYMAMFSGCTSLTTAPELPASTLANECYRQMFLGCTALTTAPSSIGTSGSTMGVSGCTEMFKNCTSLTTAPELPATTLASSCYMGMFNGCTALTTAPELPATTLADSCYRQMFYWCSSLNYIKCLATDISATNCTNVWVNGVASTGTFVKTANWPGWTTGSSGIPNGWTVEDAPADYKDMYLTFEILSDGEICWGADSYVIDYRINGGSWTTITGVAEGVWISVLSGDTVEFRGNNSQYNSIGGFGYVNDWASPQKTPTATFNVYGNIMSLCYGDNFIGQTTLPANGTFYQIFGCPSWTTDFNTALISAEHLILPATALTESCYRDMFCHCSSLTTAPELPATTLANYCYQNMFAGCSSLNYIKCLATDISVGGPTLSWVQNVSQTGTFVKDANMSDWETGDNGIPTGWTVIDA